MKKELLFMSFLIGCSESDDPQPEPLYLDRDFYSWTCKDYEDLSEIIVTTTTCEDTDSGLHWIIAEYRLNEGGGFKRRMDQTENWNIDCIYETTFPLIDEYCIQVEGVTLTAYVDSPSWSGVFGN